MQPTALRVHFRGEWAKRPVLSGCSKFLFEVCRYDYQIHQWKYPALQNAGYRHPCQHNWDSRRRSRKAMGNPASDFCRHLCSRLPGAAASHRQSSEREGWTARLCLPAHQDPSAIPIRIEIYRERIGGPAPTHPLEGNQIAGCSCIGLRLGRIVVGGCPTLDRTVSWRSGNPGLCVSSKIHFFKKDCSCFWSIAVNRSLPKCDVCTPIINLHGGMFDASTNPNSTHRSCECHRHGEWVFLRRKSRRRCASPAPSRGDQRRMYMQSWTKLSGSPSRADVSSKMAVHAQSVRLMVSIPLLRRSVLCVTRRSTSTHLFPRALAAQAGLASQAARAITGSTAPTSV